MRIMGLELLPFAILSSTQFGANTNAKKRSDWIDTTLTITKAAPMAKGGSFEVRQTIGLCEPGRRFVYQSDFGGRSSIL